MRILVILDCPETARLTLETAGALAHRVAGATLRVLQPHPATDPDYQSPDEGMPDTATRLRFARGMHERSERLHQLCMDWARTAGHATAPDWVERAGDIRTVVAQEATGSNLVVLARPRSNGPASAGQALAGALYDARTAVVLAPMQPLAAIGRHPVVAWHASPALERAIESAWPLLAMASRVTLIMGERQPGSQPDPTLVATLRQAGVVVDVMRFATTDEPIGTQILSHAVAAQGDLLVMGAYDRPHVVEWLFGGATTNILTHATLPVLIHH